MKKLCLALLFLYGAPLLPGCASTPSESHSWKVEPFETIRHATNRPDGYYQLGRYYQGQNRLELAAEAYQKALAIDPHFTEAHNGLGTIYASQGKYGQALSEFNAAIAMAPDAARMYNNLGYLNLLEGKYAEAVAALTKATTLDPTNEKARNNLGMALAKSGEPMKSNQAFAQALQDTTSAQSRAANDLNHVASGDEVHTTTTTLALPEDRAIIASTSANKPERNVEERLDSDNTREDKAIHAAKLGQTNVQPPFAVLEKSNPKAMPVVVMSGSPHSTINEVSGGRPKTLHENTPAVITKIAQANSAPNVIAADKTAAKTQVAMTSPKAIAPGRAPYQVAPLNAVRPASLPGKRNFVLEISNGNGRKYLAARFGSMLSAKGLPQARLTNAEPYKQARTEIHYKKGYLFEAARLSRHLRDIQHLAFLVESKDLPSHVDVKLILGKDLSGKLKWLNNAKAITVASR